MNGFNYFMTPVGPKYTKKFARNFGIAILILFAFYGIWNLVSDIAEPATYSENYEVDKVIDTYKEKYSDYELTEYPNSKGITWKYVAQKESRNVELILGDDRVILRSYDAPDDVICTIINPFPKDVLDYCPPKW